MVVAQSRNGSSAPRKRTFYDMMVGVDPRLRLGHFRLFKAEILKSFEKKVDFLPFQNIIDGIGPSVSVSSFLHEGKFTEAANELWKLISKDDFWMRKLIDIVHQRDPKLYSQMLKEIHPDSLECYVKFFSDENGVYMDLITGSLEPLTLARSLPKEYSELLSKVTDYMETKMYDEASCYLMRSLPYVQSVDDDVTAWYFDFLNACLRDPNNCTIPKFIDPDYYESLSAYNTRIRVKMASHSSQDGVSSSAEALGIVDEDIEDINRPCRSQEEYKQFRLRGLGESVLAKLCDAERIELYSYQEELVAVAERGVNTIICAPTGSGKTVVAAHIIIDHLKKLQEQDEIGRVAMLVPTVPLVDQQCTMLNRFMRKIFFVEGMSGSELMGKDGRAPFVLASHITVFTPQIFINLLKSVKKDDRLYFNDFTMFVFDECHHCDRDHPYSVLMRMLHDYEGPKPQIIGLTASLPLGSGRLNVEAALDRMLQLCARLDAHSITTVRKYSKDLSDHVTPPLAEVIRARNCFENNFMTVIVECMARMENAIRHDVQYVVKTLGLRPDEIAIPTERRSVRYEGFIGSLKARLYELSGGKWKIPLIKTLDHLAYYYRALCLNDLLPDRYAYDYLRDKIEKEKVPEDAESLTNQSALKQLFKEKICPAERNFASDDNGESKEILKKLHDVLVNQYKRERASRTIIFVTTRLLAEKLADHLNHTGILDRGVVGYLTSSNQTSALGGQTTEKQQQMIDCFSRGVIKVLVATSVAEEGLNIPACNLIIKYNNAGSETSLIQRRGRARAKNSKSILLVLDGLVEEKELENVQREHLMHLCLDHIQTKSESQMKALVDYKLEEEEKLRRAVLAQAEERRKMLANKSYNLCCSSCRAVICKSSDMRITCDSQYIVCCDPDIWKRIDVRMLKNARPFAIATEVAKAHCIGSGGEARCIEDLGTVVKLFGTFLPVLSAKSVVVDDPEDTSIRGQKHKKWKDIINQKFFVDPLTERDLKLMLRSLYNFSKDKHDELEQEAQLAVERTLQAMKREKRQRFFIEE